MAKKGVLAVMALLVVVICAGAAVFMLWEDTDPADNFEITGTIDGWVCYGPAVYLDGYVYLPTEWLSYSIYSDSWSNYQDLIDDKLGRVTLDLRGKEYTGIPPDFSGTVDVGTEIYSIKNVKTERAVLAAEHGYVTIFYRIGKALADDRAPIDLSVLDVFYMLSDCPEVAAVELRSSSTGSWMRTSENKQLLLRINTELPNLSIINAAAFRQVSFNYDSRIPVNLIFTDGAVMHLQVFPEDNCANLFGGMIDLSGELCGYFEKLLEEGKAYPSLADLLPFAEDEVFYLFFSNLVTGEEILCPDPVWSRDALFLYILNYYLVEEVHLQEGARHVMVGEIGETEADSIFFNFYEVNDKQIVIELYGLFYKPVKGQLYFENLESYFKNSTGLDEI